LTYLSFVSFNAPYNPVHLMVPKLQYMTVINLYLTSIQSDWLHQTATLSASQVSIKHYQSCNCSVSSWCIICGPVFSKIYWQMSKYIVSCLQLNGDQ